MTHSPSRAAKAIGDAVFGTDSPEILEEDVFIARVASPGSSPDTGGFVLRPFRVVLYVTRMTDGTADTAPVIVWLDGAPDGHPITTRDD